MPSGLKPVPRRRGAAGAHLVPELGGFRIGRETAGEGGLAGRSQLARRWQALALARVGPLD